MVRSGGVRMVAVVVAAFLGGALVQLIAPGGRMAHAQERTTPQVVEAQAFRLVDAEGRERGNLSVAPEGALLVLKDDQGRDRLTLGRTGGEEPSWSLVLGDAEGHDRFTCGARADGKGSGMALHDWNGTLRFGLGAQDYGCGFVLRNEQDKEVLGAGAGPTGGGDFFLKHPFDGHELWRASQHIAPAE